MRHTIEIKEKEYPVKFGFLAFKYFAKIKGFTKPSQIDELFAKINYNDLSFDNMDDLTNLVLCGIKTGCEMEKQECDLTLNDIYELYENDPDQFSNTLTEYFDSLPKQEKEKKQKAVKK